MSNNKKHFPDLNVSDSIEESYAHTYQPVSFIRSALVPAIILSVIVGVMSIFLPFWAGLLLVIAFLLWSLAAHYRELKRFALWLSYPKSQNVPSGHGVWTDIFAKLYALRRMDEKHEAQLAEWLARFQSTMSHLPDGVVLMDKLTNLEWTNPVAEGHFHLDLQRDLGTRLVHLVRDPGLVKVIQSHKYNQPFKLKYMGLSLELQLIDFESDRIILVSRDITETERVDAMRRDFIANASHELRTPLTVISGFLEHAEEAPDMPLAQRMQQLGLMRQQADRMTVLIQDMLMLSRLESDVHVDAQMIDMPILIKQQIQSAEILSAGRHIIHNHIENLNLHGNEQEIASVVGNLLSNAVRYTPEGGEIWLAWGRNAQQQPTLLVSDNGVGIAAEYLPRLTERFYRVNTAKSRATKGTGLGLAIVKHILIRHHAQLRIESAVAPSPHQGTTFVATFPIKFPTSTVVNSAHSVVTAVRKAVRSAI